MFDGGKIVAGLIVFALVATVPVWYGGAFGSGETEPVLEKVNPVNGTRCVLDNETMRAEHMKLLQRWRTSVVRDEERFFEGPAPAGMARPEKSLTNTCLGCHGDKKKFCDRCHDYAAVVTDCWNCHIAPEGNN